MAEVVEDNQVFKALADPSRRQLLDALHDTDGQTLSQLCSLNDSGADMSRQAVSKHLNILERASLITTRMAGRNKLHFLNPVPITEISTRWLSKFHQHQASELIRLRNRIEDNHHD
jgi:DNA-binding transcriptional ArsR family regulator